MDTDPFNSLFLQDNLESIECKN